MTNVNYNFTENGVVYDFDDVFVSAEIFRKPSLWIWGLNSSGQLGINATTDRSTPVTTILGGTNWRSVSGNGYHTSAIKTDGTLWVWGNGGSGRLGINDTINRSIPITTILGGTNWKSVSCGDSNIFSIKTDGTLWGWGFNNFGQLGINVGLSDLNINRSTPVTTILGGTNWKQVSSGGSHTAAIKTDGTLWTWGRNNTGQLGINDTIDRSTPVTTILGETNWKSVSCANFHTTAIKTDGTLWVWGEGARGGQLGVNATTDRSTPVTTILGGTDWKSVDCGYNHTAAIKTDGTLWVWGQGIRGQLGVNDTIDRSTPVTTILGGTNWKSVSTNGTNLSATIAAIKTDGTLWICGRGQFGQLGINLSATRSTPVTTILGGNNWKQVSCAKNLTVAIEYEPDP